MFLAVRCQPEGIVEETTDLASLGPWSAGAQSSLWVDTATSSWFFMRSPSVLILTTLFILAVPVVMLRWFRRWGWLEREPSFITTREAKRPGERGSA